MNKPDSPYTLTLYKELNFEIFICGLHARF